MKKNEDTKKMKSQSCCTDEKKRVKVAAALKMRKRIRNHAILF